MGDSSRHPSRTKRPWNSVSEPGRDLRTSYHGGKRGRRDPGVLPRREFPLEFPERVPLNRRTGREYAAMPLERRPGPYSPKTGRVQPRYRSPPKASTRHHENADTECSPRLHSESRHLPASREQLIFPRQHWMHPWNDACPPAPSEMRWIEHQEASRHIPQAGRHAHSSDIQGSVPFPVDETLGIANHSFPNILPNSVSSNGGGFLKLEPRDSSISRPMPFKTDAREDVVLEPRTRISDDPDRLDGKGDGMGPQKRLGFGDSVWYRRKRSEAAQVSAKPVDPHLEPNPPLENAHDSDTMEKQETTDVPDCKESLEQQESVTGDSSELQKDNTPISKAETIVMEMNKLDDEIRELDQLIIDAEQDQNEAEEHANDLARKAEAINQEGSSCSQVVVSSSADSENGESQSNFVIRSPSGGSQSGEVDVAGKMGLGACGHSLCEQGNGVISLPAASKTVSVRSTSDQDVSTTNRSASNQHIEKTMVETSKALNLFDDDRFTQVLKENHETAQASSDEVWKGLPECFKGEGLEQKRQHLEIQWDSSRVKPLLRTIRKWNRNQEAKEKELALEYARLLEELKIKVEEGVICNMESEYVDELSRKPNRSYRVARSDYGEFKLVRELMGREELESMVKMPDRILYPWQGRMWINRNRLVRDPAADLCASMERSPWTDEEKKIFMEKFLEHPKEFRTIASFLDKRTTSDCIDLYYRIQKLDEFAWVRRKQQLKKRRQHAETKRIVGYCHLMLSPSEKARQFSSVSPQARSRIRGNGNINSPRPHHSSRLNPHDGTHLHPGRYHSEDVPWSDKEFIDAIRCHGPDMKAIAALFECSVKAVGAFALENRRRLGLDEVMAERDQDTLKNSHMQPEHHELMNQTKSMMDEDVGAYCDIDGSKEGRIGCDDPLPFFPTVGPHSQHTSIQMAKGEMGQTSRDAITDNKVDDMYPFDVGVSGASAPSTGPERFVDNLSLFTKHSQDNDELQAGPLSVGERSPALNWAMSMQALQGNQQTFHQAPSSVLPSGLPSTNYDQNDPQYLGNQNDTSHLALPNLLSAADMYTLKALWSQSMQQNSQQSAPLLCDARPSSDIAVPVRTGDFAIETSASFPAMPRGFPDRLGTALTFHPVPTENTALRPSLLSGNSDTFVTPAFNPGEETNTDGPQPQHSHPGAPNSDISALSSLFNTLQNLPSGAPGIHPDQNQFNSLWTAATAIQLLYGSGNQLASQPGTSQPATSELPTQNFQASSQGYPPLFLASQTGSSAFGGQHLSSMLDRFCFQGTAGTPQPQGQHQHVAEGTMGGSGGQDSLRQMCDSRLVNLLLAGMVFQPQLQAVMQSSNISSQPPGLLYQGIGTSQPLVTPSEVPVSGANVILGTDGRIQMGMGVRTGKPDSSMEKNDVPQDASGTGTVGPKTVSSAGGLGEGTGG